MQEKLSGCENLNSGKSTAWKWIILLSWRSLRSKRREKSNIAGLMSVAGISVGVAALLVVLGVMNGFQSSTISNILELNSYHLRISADEQGKIPDADLTVAIPGVRSAVKFAEVQTLVQSGIGQPRGVMVRGIPEDYVQRDPGFASRIRLQSGGWFIDGNQTVIGADLARQLGVRVGDVIHLVHFTGSGVLRPQEAEYRVAGIYRSDYYEFDRGYIFVSLDRALTQLGADRAVLGIKLHDRFTDREIARRILADFDGDFGVQRWRDFDRAIFGALQLEKWLMTLLLGMVFVVVGVNIYQSLRRSVIEQTVELGVLKALGASPLSVQLIFVIEGALIGLSGAFFGSLLGWFLARNLNEIIRMFRQMAGSIGPMIWGPVPVLIFPAEAAAILLFAISSTLLAGYAASRRISSILPSEVLRNE